MTKRKPSGKGRSSSTPRRAARHGDNTLDGRALPYLTRIERHLDDLDSKRGAYMAACKRVREQIKDVYGDAKDHGIAVKALKGLVEYRVLEKKQAKIADGLDIDEAAAYQELVQALGPLGLAAAAKAGYLPEDARDLRPRHLQDAEREREAAANGSGEASPRADEAELARVGRGHEPEAPPAEPAGETAH